MDDQNRNGLLEPPLRSHGGAARKVAIWAMWPLRYIAGVGVPLLAVGFIMLVGVTSGVIVSAGLHAVVGRRYDYFALVLLIGGFILVVSSPLTVFVPLWLLSKLRVPGAKRAYRSMESESGGESVGFYLIGAPVFLGFYLIGGLAGAEVVAWIWANGYQLEAVLVLAAGALSLLAMRRHWYDRVTL